MTSFIQKRRNLYYARLRVPDDLKAQFKKTVLLKSLGTGNKEEAQTRAYAVICRWRTQIKAARGSIDAIEK